jgi:glycosyltransferase involved in cell wall biosynthesis/GR25 family glycosyltransferase involved in LPS biosynthesis
VIATNNMKLNVLFHVGYYDNLFSPLDRELGGTEQVLLNTVKHLAKEFNVYVTGDVAEMTVDGVEYLNRELLWKTKRKYDIVIGVGYIHFLLDLENKVDYHKSYLWLHNTEYYPYYNGETLPNEGRDLLPKLSGIICVSQWHKQNTAKKYNYPLDKIKVIFNSVDATNFTNEEKVKDSFIYSSHPERGLNTLLELWYYIKDIKPNATLKVFCPKYGLDVFNQIYKKLNLKDVQFIGNVDAKTLRQEYSKAEYWFYPTEYEETFCITAVEAQLAGCKIITSPIGALSEIIHTAEFIEHPGEELGYYLDIIKIIDYPAQEDRVRYNKRYASIFNIDVIGKAWSYLINSCYSFDCVYIISLDKTDEYKQDALKRLKESKIQYESIAFINGIDGRKPNPGFDFKPWNGWKIGDEYEQNRIDKKFKNESSWYQRDITPGEVGCVLSHIKCWKDASENNFNSVLVLEEDFALTQPFNQNIITTLPKWDLVHLGRNLMRDLPEQNYNAYFVRPLFSFNAHAYALSKNGIDILLSKKLEENLIPTDEFLPTLYDTHFRTDIVNLLSKNDNRKLNAFATTVEYIVQKGNKSQTENIHLTPIETPKLTIKIMDKEYTPLYPELYQYWNDTSAWHRKFLVPGLIKKEWELFVDEEFDGTFAYPFFTKQFCKMIIEEAEHAKVWTFARHEFYPTTDFVLTEIGFDKIYYDLLWEYVMPMAMHKFGLEGKGWDQLHAENFLARYTPDTQGHLSLHHDNSHITALVNLSEKDEDYTGGGTWFWRQKKLSRPPQGYISVHPGNITHKHGARPVLSGKRYIIVSFMKNKEF